MSSNSSTSSYSSSSGDSSNGNVNDDVNESFYDAAEEGSLVKLNEAVANGADIHYLSPKQLPGWEDDDYGDGTGNSALHVACCKGLRPIIDRLLELGANIHLKTTKVTCLLI